MGYKPTRRTVVASSGLVAAGLAGCMGSSEHEDDDGENGDDGGGGGDGGDGGSSNNPNNRTVEWMGQGDEFADLDDCDEAFWKWILTPGGRPPIEDDPLPQLTVTFGDNEERTYDGFRPGQGVGAYQFEVFRDDLEDEGAGIVESAFVTFEGGGANPILTISEGFCINGEPPSVVTLDATAVNAGSATLQGNLESLGDFETEDFEVFFRWRAIGDEDFEETEPQVRTTTGTFSETIDGLEPGEYEFQAVARVVDQEITVSGLLFSFEKFQPEQPNFETTSATDVNESTATLNGVVTDLGEFEEIEVFFEWGLVDDEENWEQVPDPGVTLDEDDEFPFTLSETVDGLEVGETYGYRLVVIAGEDRKEGAIRVFTKDPDDPDVKTKKPTDVNKSTATLNANLTDMGDFEYVYVYFQYREEGTEEWSSTEPQKRTETSAFSATIEDLKSGTTYEFRAVASANDVTILGEERYFTKPDEKKQPDVKKDTTLKAVCYEKKNGKKVKFAVTNDTKHELKFSWKVKKGDQGGKLVVPKDGKQYFWVTEYEKPLDVALYFDSKKIHTASTKDADKSCKKE